MWRVWRPVVAMALLAVALMQPGAVAADDHGGGAGCEEGSTARMVVIARNPSAPRLGLTIRTDADGLPSGKLRYRHGIPGQPELSRLEIHRVFVKGSHAEAADHGRLGAGIRGLGWLNDGTFVRVHVDMMDLEVDQHVDRFRIRWRGLEEHESGDVATLAKDSCDDGGWLYDSGWLTIDHLAIHAPK